MTESTKRHPLLDEFFKNRTYEDLLTINSSDAETVKDTIDRVERMMQQYARKITYTQIRNILQLVKNKAFKNNLGAFYKTLPLLAYMEARLTREDEGRQLISFIRELASNVKTDFDEHKKEEKQYVVFLDIMNTIVAYHKLNN